MSAIAWEPTTGHAGPQPSRPRLVVLPGGVAGAPPARGLRMTARGRLVLLALAAAVLAGVLGVGGVGGAGAAPAEHSVTVGSGQTLSEIAATELPGLSVSAGVLAIQLANGLNTAQVNAGQRLVIPRG